MLIKRLSIIPLLTVLLLLATVGLAALNAHTSWVRQAEQKVPVIKAPVAMGVNAGKTLTTLGVQTSGYVSGLFLPANHPDSLQGKWQKSQQAFSRQYPALVGTAATAGEAAKVMASRGKEASGYLMQEFFPDEKTRNIKHQAEARKEQLSKTLEEKQNELTTLQTQVGQMQTEVHQLDRTAHPIKRIIPDSFKLPSPKDAIAAVMSSPFHLFSWPSGGGAGYSGGGPDGRAVLFSPNKDIPQDSQDNTSGGSKTKTRLRLPD